MLETLFGSNTAEKTLLYIEAYGKAYPAEIAKTFGISNTQVQRTTEKLENADILIGQPIGRARIYTFNPRYILTQEIRQLLQKTLLYLPADIRQQYFSKRTRPRKKNKP